MIQDLALVHVTSCAEYGTVSYRLFVVIRKIYVEIFHGMAQCTVQCALIAVVSREES